MAEFRALVLAAIFFPGVALAQPASDPKASALAADLRTAMIKAEQHAGAAGFPRGNILAAVSRSMWETFYHSDCTSAQEAIAVNMVSSEASTAMLKEAAMRMKYELELN